MKTKSLILTSLMLTIFALPISADDVDVTGQWEITTESPRGTRTSTVEFKQEGEKLTVISQGFQGEKIESEGTVKGNEISWSSTRSTQRGEFTISYTGTIEGDTMKGEVQFGEMGKAPWTAKRKVQEQDDLL